ncbi:MAG: polysaccharide deacetylase family protein [Hyphomicrobiales bacterium]|nr:polysaccharide deacetylase family protein [Hyphomicrobiales bacterium]
MYHYVRPDPGPRDPSGQNLSVTPEDFAAQVQHLATAGYTSLTLAELADVRAKRAALPSKPVVLTFDDGYRDFYTNAWPVLQRHGFKATVFVITGVVGQTQYLTWDMIGELDASGSIEIASHTVNHRELPAISETNARAEVTNSRAVLEERLGHPVWSFCYPVGRYSARDAALLRAAGYAIAVTTQAGWSRADSDPMLLPRVRVTGPRALTQIRATLP